MTLDPRPTGRRGGFSVVIPTYQRERTVQRAITSATDQSLPPLEIIVVDDGSTDGTGVLLRSLPLPVRTFRQAQSGVAAARNRGACLKSGPRTAV